MKVFVIRHGETEHNVEGGITGQLDIQLNQYGREQAEKLAERLETENFDAAYSSDFCLWSLHLLSQAFSRTTGN